jgi:hypothetical protein
MSKTDICVIEYNENTKYRQFSALFMDIRKKKHWRQLYKLMIMKKIFIRWSLIA